MTAKDLRTQLGMFPDTTPVVVYGRAGWRMYAARATLVSVEGDRLVPAEKGERVVVLVAEAE